MVVVDTTCQRMVVRDQNFLANGLEMSDDEH